MPGEAVSFHTSLYEADAVDDAVEAFGHLARFTVTRKEHEVVVDVAEVDERVADRLVDAFCNHVLFDTVTRRRTGAPQ